jgi:threonine dehydratase
MALDLAAITAAHERIRRYVHRTPVLTSSRLDTASSASLFFKCENFQKVGAFKARGATNAVFALDEALAQRGVATHSSGNHAAALSRAASLRGIAAHIVMPSNAPKVKVRAVEGYGGRIVFCEPNQRAREAACARVIAETGATLIHPFENEQVMAGQGTVGIELMEEIPDLDLVLCPVGGGGLLCGTAVAVKTMQPGTRVIATEPAGASDAAESFQQGQLVYQEKKNTIADGLLANLGAINFALIRRYVDDVVTVSDEAIVAAMRTIWETMKIVIEPSAAVPYAAVLEARADLRGQRVGIILTGGNVDLDSLPWIK